VIALASGKWTAFYAAYCLLAQAMRIIASAIFL